MAGIAIGKVNGSIFLEIEKESAVPDSVISRDMRRGEAIGLLGTRERIELAGGQITEGVKEGGGSFIRALWSLPNGRYITEKWSVYPDSTRS